MITFSAIELRETGVSVVAAAESTAPVRSRARTLVRDAAVATKFLLAGLGIAILSAGTLLLTLAVALLCLAGIGLVLVRPMTLCVRAVAGLERDRLRWMGAQVVPPYEAVPAAPLAALRHVLTDPANRRDLAWLVTNATFGMLITLFGVQAPVSAVQEITRPAWWSLVPPSRSYALNGLVPVHSWPVAFLTATVGLVWAVFWFLGPWLVRVHARPAVVLLNPHPDVDLSARVAELTTSRAAALDAHAVELRRIERALHDGAQNRLVGVTVLAGAARQALAQDPAKAEPVLERMQTTAEEALAELRSVVRSILPPVLADRGLAGALSALAAECAVPCQVTVDIPVRSPLAVESTAYFGVAEALTNASRHSGAGEVIVDVRRTGDRLVVGVRDDGRGGADRARGSGLQGMLDRVEALDGAVEISSPSGGPTVLRVELPCGS